MGIKETVDSWFRNYTSLLFYVPVAVSMVLVFTGGKVPASTITLPSFVIYLALVISTYSFYLLHEDFRMVCSEHDNLNKKLQSVPQQQPKQQNYSETIVDDDFDKVLGGLK